MAATGCQPGSRGLFWVCSECKWLICETHGEACKRPRERTGVTGAKTERTERSAKCMAKGTEAGEYDGNCTLCTKVKRMEANNVCSAFGREAEGNIF